MIKNVIYTKPKVKDDIAILIFNILVWENTPYFAVFENVFE